MSEISAEAREELVQAIARRYRSGAAPEKSRILDEFVAVPGYHRKHAIRVLNATRATKATTTRGDQDSTTRRCANR
jgi:hypothetical protein